MKRIWFEGNVVDLAGRAIEAALNIEDLLDHRKVSVGEGYAWGQYLDADHYSEAHWGLFGTSAAVQVFASNNATADGDIRIKGALEVLPREVPTNKAILQEKVASQHLSDIIRLASIAEALLPTEDHVSEAQRPAIVDTILGMSDGQPFWHPTKAALDERPTKGDPLATAFILHALRRYEHPDGTGFREYRSWLADQFLNRSMIRSQPHVVAMIGLALQPPKKDPSPPANVIAAHRQCVISLIEWRRKERGLVVNRPIFHGYQLDGKTEYILLNPELLATLYFLRSGNPSKARRFVLGVVGAVTATAETHEGFEGQPGASPTVDQMWAVKLLRTFRAMNDDPGHRLLLRPRLTSVLRIRWWTVLAAILVMVLAVGITSNWGMGAAVAFFASALVNVIVAVAQEQNG
jgi:hypothetical protein